MKPVSIEYRRGELLLYSPLFDFTTVFALTDSEVVPLFVAGAFEKPAVSVKSVDFDALQEGGCFIKSFITKQGNLFDVSKSALVMTAVNRDFGDFLANIGYVYDNSTGRKVIRTAAINRLTSRFLALSKEAGKSVRITAIVQQISLNEEGELVDTFTACNDTVDLELLGKVVKSRPMKLMHPRRKTIREDIPDGLIQPTNPNPTPIL